MKGIQILQVCHFSNIVLFNKIIKSNTARKSIHMADNTKYVSRQLMCQFFFSSVKTLCQLKTTHLNDKCFYQVK